MCAIGDIDELRDNTDLVPGTLHAAFKHSGNVENLANFTDIFIGSFKLE